MGILTCTPMGTPTGTPMGPEALYRLLTWMSPAYPTGAYTCSHGLEWSIEAGAVTDRPNLEAWIGALLRHGGGHSDAVLLAHAWRAARDGDADALPAVAELAAALAPSRERFEETSGQGTAFLAVTRAAWPCPALDRLAGAGTAALPVVVGAAAAGHGIALDDALAAYLHGFAANLVSTGVRLIPLGQTDGQRILAALEPLVAAAAAAARDVPIEAIGSAAILSDIASMRHETQETRLFRT